MKKRTLVVDRKSLSQYEILSETLDPQSLENGQALLRVERFSFTANNISYAMMGEALGYWNFFPVTADKGVIPVWGFGEVVATRCEDVRVGERYYGYFPFSTHLIVKPVRSSSAGFFDGEQHRLILPSIYNQYLRCSSDPLYQVETEAVQMLLRPLFTTSFLLEDFFRDNDFFGAEAIILTSASSKTAIGMAFMLGLRRVNNTPGLIIGLTSTGNSEFTRGLGCYDKVYTYEDLDQLALSGPCAIVDFAGVGDVTSKLHRILSPDLKYSCVVGASHGTTINPFPTGLPGPSPVMFFAPSQAGKRWQEWGKELFEKRLIEGWNAFTAFACQWLELEFGYGKEQVLQEYEQVLAGKIAPSKGLILSLFDEQSTTNRERTDGS